MEEIDEKHLKKKLYKEEKEETTCEFWWVVDYT
jgi:hypothetical protein